VAADRLAIYPCAAFDLALCDAVLQQRFNGDA
jgi:hypothetical protein